MTTAHTPIRVAINGYGNLGRAVELAVHQSPDMELVAIFTRRDPAVLEPRFAPAVHIDQAEKYTDLVDVCVLCGGSATDLGEQTPQFTQMFNTVDSFDTHAKIPDHFAAVDQVARQANHVAVISSGWDPGLFSINRLIGESVLPHGDTYTFWGRGVSQGHSDAIRRIDGVVGAVQYTVPVEQARQSVLAGEAPQLSTRDKHRRECFVVAEADADRDRIREQIVTMENYFTDYDTTVTFISAEELARDHTGMPHGGSVIRSGQTSEGVNQVYSFNLTLESNPEFTGAMVTATARAAARLAAEGKCGALTVFDIPPAYYSPKDGEQLRAELL